MRDGLKVFTSFTNSLKKIDNKEREDLFRTAAAVEVKVLRGNAAKIKPESWTKERSGSGRIFYTRAISATKREANDRVMQMVFEAGNKTLSAPSPAPSHLTVT